MSEIHMKEMYRIYGTTLNNCIEIVNYDVTIQNCNQ